MKRCSIPNQHSRFKRILVQNIALPLVLGLFTAGVFVGIILYLLRTAAWVEHTDQVLITTARMQTSIMDAETGFRAFLVTRDPKTLYPFELARERWAVDAPSVKNLVSDNPVQTDRFQRIEATYSLWVAYVERTKLRADKSEIQRAELAAIVEEGRLLMDDFRRRFTEVLNDEDRLRISRTREVQDFSRAVLFIVIGLSLVSALAIAVWGRKQLMALSGNYEGLLKTQEEQNLRLMREQWFDQGRGQVIQGLLGQTTLAAISDRVLERLTEFLGASVAAFYVSDRNGQGFFRRVATFAVDPESIDQRRNFKTGETLLGLAVKDRKIHIETDLPADYFKVSSGLGSTSAKSVMIIPISTGDEVNSVIELGFIGKVEDKVMNFVEQTTSSIAVAVQSVRYREQLEELLSEVQSQAEELQAQQEELRVSNEELEAQTKLLREAQTRTDNQNAELEETNLQLEKQASLLEDQKESLDRRNEELLRSRREIESKATELSRASHYKSEFLANMSHELRTPLNSSLILSQLLAENRGGNLSDQQVEYANQITKCGRDLLMLINDVLDISKVESGKMDIEAENFSLESLCFSMTKLFEPLALQKKLEFVVVNRSSQTRLETDRQRLEQILKNLISNAIKFTDKGQVRLEIDDVDPKGERLNFVVRDTGIGIQSENLDIIFEAFRQADGTTSRKYGGTGLGLSISRELARLLGGNINVDSELHKGSAFYMDLPRVYKPIEQNASAPSAIELVETKSLAQLAREKAELEAAPAPRNQPLPTAVTKPAVKESNRHVLIIEDDLTFAGVVRDLVTELGFHPLLAETADEGVEIAIREKPFAVVLDMKLPDHTGLYVLDVLKNDRRTRHIPVHVISVDDFSAHALRMGAMGYFLKPVKRDEIGRALMEMRERFLEGNQKVLVIEDDEAQRMAIQGLIEGESVQIETASTGAAGLQKLQEGHFDCVILDLSLPDTSGFQLLEEMSTHDDRRYPPVIVYTGRELSRDEETQLKKYSKSIIVKGARSPERLLDEVSLFLHQVESQLPPRQQKVLDELRSREKVLDGRHLLLVDDDMRNVFALTAALEHRGARLTVARNGAEAVDALRKCAEDGANVDLVLMDVMMPVMDGYTAMREIRKDSRFKKLPIIALTAKAMKDDREQCMQAGANDYLAKPVQVDKLLSLIRVWLNAQSGMRR